MEENQNQFASFGLSPETLKSLIQMGFTAPTPIQQETLPILIGQQTDFLGLASTGTGKTGAFGIPLVERIDAKKKKVQGLVLCPTRELALQVSEQIKKIGIHKNVQVATIYGGDSYRRQIMAIKGGAQVVVGTPGRMVDLIDQKELNLNEVETLVLDEADEMISMGFKEALETILKATENPDIESSTWLFSATMNPDIRRVADKYLESPKTVQVKALTAEEKPKIENNYITVQDKNKLETLERLIVMNPEFYGIIFCQTKMEVAEVTEKLRARSLRVDCLHGDRTQKEREFILRQFRDRRITVIVATDVAARGLDIKDLTHVINFNLPRETESYVHRVGRTGRNGKTGIAISLVAPNQLNMLARIQRVTKLEMKKTNIPSLEEIKKFQIQARLQKISSIVLDAKVKNMWKSFLEGIPLAQELSELPSEEFMIKYLISQKMDLSFQEDSFLDYSPNRIPRELDGGSRERSGGSGGRSYDSFSRGRREFGGGRSGGFRSRRDDDSRPRRDDDSRPRRERTDRDDRPRRDRDDERPRRSADSSTGASRKNAFDESDVFIKRSNSAGERSSSSRRDRGSERGQERSERSYAGKDSRKKRDRTH